MTGDGLHVGGRRAEGKEAMPVDWEEEERVQHHTH